MITFLYSCSTMSFIVPPPPPLPPLVYSPVSCLFRCVPSKHAGSGQLWPLRPAGSRNRAGSYLPDPISHIGFGSVLPQTAWIILCKAGPDPFRFCMALLCCGQNRSVPEKKPVCKNQRPGSGQPLPGRIGGRFRAGSGMFTGFSFS